MPSVRRTEPGVLLRLWNLEPHSLYCGWFQAVLSLLLLLPPGSSSMPQLGQMPSLGWGAA